MHLKSLYLFIKTIFLNKCIKHLKSFPVMEYRQYGSIIKKKKKND